MRGTFVRRLAQLEKRHIAEPADRTAVPRRGGEQYVEQARCVVPFVGRQQLLEDPPIGGRPDEVYRSLDIGTPSRGQCSFARIAEARSCQAWRRGRLR
jgi:hypothetical protein